MRRSNVVHLVRHAKAGDRLRWQGDDAERPLTRAGLAQAQALVVMLADAPVERVLSSPALRCRQTVEPLAESRGVEVEICDALDEGSGLDGAMEVIVGGGDQVLCSHGDVILLVLEHLARLGAVRSRDLMAEKGSAWMLEVRAGQVAAARYIPAP